MFYKKIELELIVQADDAKAVVADLNKALDRMEENRAIFGGGIEAIVVEHRETRPRSVLVHTLAAGEMTAGALRTASQKVAGALWQVAKRR